MLVYTTKAFDRDTEVTGPVTLNLFAEWFAILLITTGRGECGDWPNGFAQNLTEGILRASHRDSQVKPELLNPGQIYQFSISLWSTSNVFLKGHRLRLEVSSSNFPRFDRNLNTGSSGESETRWTTATNDILHDTEHPSALVLPLIE